MIRAIAIVFLFLIRLRFPQNESLFTTIRRRYGAETTKDLRKWERAAKQLMKAELDEELLLRCHTECVVPKFLKFKIYRENLRNSPAYKDCQQVLLRNEIDYKRRIKRRLSEHLRDCKFFFNEDIFQLVRKPKSYRTF